MDLESLKEGNCIKKKMDRVKEMIALLENDQEQNPKVIISSYIKGQDENYYTNTSMHVYRNKPHEGDYDFFIYGMIRLLKEELTRLEQRLAAL